MAEKSFRNVPKSIPRNRNRKFLGSASGQPKELTGCLRVSVMALWQCWLIQFDLRNPKPQPLDDQYDDAKLHNDHANPKIAFQSAGAAGCNLSQHGHSNLDRDGAVIKTARMRC